MKLDLNTISNINVFENITGCKVKDCVTDNGKLVFIVEEETLGKALGKNGSNVQRAKQIIKKEIQIVAYSKDIKKFIEYLIYPNKAEEITIENEIVTIKAPDNTTKGKIFGRNKENLKKILEILKRHTGIKEIKIV